MLETRSNSLKHHTSELVYQRLFIFTPRLLVHSYSSLVHVSDLAYIIQLLLRACSGVAGGGGGVHMAGTARGNWREIYL